MAKNNNVVSVPVINVNILRSQLAVLIDMIPNGKIFGIEFELKHPYCTGCGRKSVKFKKGLHTCDKCGAKVRFIRVAAAQKGVVNPRVSTTPGCGVMDGISATKAKQVYNLLKFYDVNIGEYRNADYGKISKIKFNKTVYTVK